MVVQCTLLLALQICTLYFCIIHDMQYNPSRRFCKVALFGEAEGPGIDQLTYSSCFFPVEYNLRTVALWPSRLGRPLQCWHSVLERIPLAVQRSADTFGEAVEDGLSAWGLAIDTGDSSGLLVLAWPSLSSGCTCRQESSVPFR